MEDFYIKIKTWVENGEIDALFSLLADATAPPAVRETVFVQLLRCGGGRVVDGFLELLASSEACLRSLAMEALQELGAGHLDRFHKVLQGNNPDLKIRCFNVLVGVKTKLAVLPIREFLKDLVAQGRQEGDNVLAAALECLGELGRQEDLELLNQITALVKDQGGHPYLLFVVKEAEEKICSASV